MATPAPIPYTPLPINSAAELSALLSSPLTEIRRTSAIKPYLDLLNEIAFHQQRWADDIVRLTLECIEQERVADRRLALFYLFDTFCKNRRLSALYRRILAPLIHAPFVSTYKYASDVTKRAMDKLLTAWRSNNIFDSAVLDSIDRRLKEVENAAAGGGKRTADVLGDADVVSKRARTDQPLLPSPTPQPTALSPQVQETLRVLEVSLAQHPHLLPLLYDIKTMLNTPGVDVAQVAPKIAALTSALQAAMAQQQQQQQQQQLRQTPPPQPLPPQPAPQLPPPAGYPPYGSQYSQPYQPQYVPQPQPQQHYSQQHSAVPAGYPYHQQHQQPPPACYPPYQPSNAPYLQPPAPTHSYPRTSPERELKPQLQASRPKTFDTEDLKTRDEYVIASLYDLIPHRCQTCGFRCLTSDAMSAHLDYHFRLSSRQRKRDALQSQQQLTQSLYWTEQEWIDSDDTIFQRSTLATATAADDATNDADDSSDPTAGGGGGGQGRHSVAVDEAQSVCGVCGEALETYWDDEEESWMYKNAVRVAKEEAEEGAGGGGSRDEKVRERRRRVHVEFDGRIVHWACYQSLLSTQEVSAVKNEEHKATEEEMPALEPVKPESQVEN